MDRCTICNRDTNVNLSQCLEHFDKHPLKLEDLEYVEKQIVEDGSFVLNTVQFRKVLLKILLCRIASQTQ